MYNLSYFELRVDLNNFRKLQILQRLVGELLFLINANVKCVLFVKYGNVSISKIQKSEGAQFQIE